MRKPGMTGDYEKPKRKKNNINNFFLCLVSSLLGFIINMHYS